MRARHGSWKGTGEKKRGKVFTMRAVKHWPRSPGEEVDVPSLTQGQGGQCSEQPDLPEDLPAHCRGPN